MADTTHAQGVAGMEPGDVGGYHDNLREINSLNQRGGRMLSVVDLIEDGTLDIAVAGWLLARVAEGASFLCAAGPGGVGKTTLMACLLSFLPPGERILTVTDPRSLAEPDGPTCYLCHEIGAGHWYGYLWGEDAAEFLALRRQGRIAASLHADSPEEVAAQLLGPGVNATEADLAAVDLMLFMIRVGARRRISAIFEATGSQAPDLRRTVAWRPAPDGFLLEPSRTPARLDEATELISELVAKRIRVLEDVMAAVTDLYA